MKSTTVTKFPKGQDVYLLPENYVARLHPEYHDDVAIGDSTRIWQPEVYELARYYIDFRGGELCC